ncbi:hypothetical protein KSP39_PZI010119 [Platanthera zijinensis]|uniref:Uncharacterized protein n=1 Tax=Platanthera zijinensis TaxID=2320716 RepID=A0AAP0BLQ8_9ASPA
MSVTPNGALFRLYLFGRFAAPFWVNAAGRTKEGKQMNLRRRLLRFHPPALRNSPKSSVWSSHLPPPIRTLRFHPPDRPATAEPNEALVFTCFSYNVYLY